MRQDKHYFYDSNHNKWRKDTYTLEQAKQLSATLVNCTGCTNCSFLKDCTMCINCHFCENLINCNNISYCQNMVNGNALSNVCLFCGKSFDSCTFDEECGCNDCKGEFKKNNKVKGNT